MNLGFHCELVNSLGLLRAGVPVNPALEGMLKVVRVTEAQFEGKLGAEVVHPFLFQCLPVIEVRLQLFEFLRFEFIDRIRFHLDALGPNHLGVFILSLLSQWNLRG